MNTTYVSMSDCYRAMEAALADNYQKALCWDDCVPGTAHKAYQQRLLLVNMARLSGIILTPPLMEH